MEFVEEFLALQPELMFKRAEADVKSSPHNTLTVTLIFAAIFVGVLILMILFVGGICRVCKSQAVQSTETPEQVTVL